MSKRRKITKGVVMVMSLLAGNAQAEVNHWTGLYAGAEGTFIFNDVQLNAQQLGFTNPSNTCNTSLDLFTFSPGIQVGYAYQFPYALVSSLEANLIVNTNQEESLGCRSDINPVVYDRFLFKNQMQGAIKGRLGRALNWRNYVLLPYITVGVSFAELGLTYENEGGDYYSTNTSKAGWLLGAGIEWAFRQQWSLRTEYSYVGYGSAINLGIPSVYGLIDTDGKANVDLGSNNLVVAVNYWFWRS